MPCRALGSMRNLLTARDARSRDHSGRPLRLDRGKKTETSDLHRELVVLCLEPERSRHTAATCVDLFDRDAGNAREERHACAGSDERLLMTVAVKEDAP